MVFIGKVLEELVEKKEKHTKNIFGGIKMSFERQVNRNYLKKWLKTNKIQKDFYNFQIEKYSLGVYEDMQRQNKKKRR